jgi:RNA polymerase sigma-70 factor (ECF subfamily)
MRLFCETIAMAEAIPVDPRNQVAHWLKHAAAGEEAAYRRLVETHFDQVESLLHRLTRDEALTDTFVKAYFSLGQVRDAVTLPGWFARIATRLYADHLRRARRVAWLKLGWSRVAWPARQSAPDASASLLAAEASREARQHLENLSAPLRIAWALREWAGLSEMQIADLLQCPVGTVQSRLHRARRRLAALGRHEWEQDGL